MGLIRVLLLPQSARSLFAVQLFALPEVLRVVLRGNSVVDSAGLPILESGFYHQPDCQPRAHHLCIYSPADDNQAHRSGNITCTDLLHHHLHAGVAHTGGAGAHPAHGAFPQQDGIGCTIRNRCYRFREITAGLHPHCAALLPATAAISRSVDPEEAGSCGDGVWCAFSAAKPRHPVFCCGCLLLRVDATQVELQALHPAAFCCGGGGVDGIHL